MKTGLRKVAVAVTYNPDIDQFLMLKRSESRERFPEKWEFPSGFVEEDEAATDAALRELEEETGLVGTAVRTGESFEVEDGEDNFLVHPVLIKVESEDIRITGEHSDYNWLQKERIDSLDTVPNIKRDLRNVGIE